MTMIKSYIGSSSYLLDIIDDKELVKPCFAYIEIMIFNVIKYINTSIVECCGIQWIYFHRLI